MAAVSQPIPLGVRLPKVWTADEHARTRIAGIVAISRTALADGAVLIGIVFSIPFAVLVVGSPIALAIVAVLWAARWALNAF